METKLTRIRRCKREDAMRLAEVYEDAWRNAYQGIIPHLQLERLISLRGPAWWEDAAGRQNPPLVVELNGEAFGYATYGQSRQRRSPFRGEIYEIYLDPVYQGLGFGSRLFSAARQRLMEVKLKGLMIWALADNDAACSFYLGLGGKPVAEGAERFGEANLRKVAFAWR